MRWGVELWDRFEDVSNYVHKGIEFCEKYEEFCKKRCSIENTYAKHLRKLIETFEPKKKDAEENNTSHLKCYVKMLNELKDVAGQHELVAENIEERIIVKLNQLVRSLKDERRKCIDDKEKYSAEHAYSEDQLDKSKQKYERAFKELDKAKELFFKIDNDDHSSKSDIRKQKTVCDLKQTQLNTAEAEYGKQLCEANKSKSLFYREQLPAVLDSLQHIELKRISQFKSFICECVNLEVEVMPRIGQCHDEIERAARLIEPERDAELPVALYKTGYSIPNDYVFEDLNEMKNSVNYNASSLNQSTNGSLSSTHHSANGHHHHQTSRQKKYRTISRLKGIFLLSSSSNKAENDLYSLPPQQLKKELNKKIETLQIEIVKQQKEREGILKLKDIYSKNQKLGDAQATAHALELNEEKLNNLTNELRNYQDILNEVESNGCVSNTNNNRASKHVSQQHSASSNDYSSSSSSSTNGNRNGTLPREKLTQMHIYQAPGDTQANSSQPGTPNSMHSNAPSTTPVKQVNQMSENNNNSSGAYAVSPVSQLMTNTKMAPINHNESFDDDDDEDEDDEDDYDDGCYEHPSAALKAAVKYNSAVTKALTDSSTTSTTTKSDSIKSASTKMITNESNSNNVSKQQNVSSCLTDNTASIIYADSQYDHVDSSVFNQNVMMMMTTTTTSQQEDADYEEKDLIIGTALVMYAFEGNVQNAMSIQENESLNVLERDKGDGWTLVKRLNGEKGYVPTDYIRIVYY